MGGPDLAIFLRYSSKYSFLIHRFFDIYNGMANQPRFIIMPVNIFFVVRKYGEADMFAECHIFLQFILYFLGLWLAITDIVFTFLICSFHGFCSSIVSDLNFICV